MTDARHREISSAKGYLFAIGATALWSINYVIARGISDAIPPVALAFWRWFTALVCLAPFALGLTVRHLPQIRRHLPYLTMSALTGVTVFNTLVYMAGHTTTAVNLSLIAISSPLVIIIAASILYQERLTLVKAEGMLLTILGILLLITQGSLHILLELKLAIGDLYMLLAAITFGGYSLLVKRKPDDLPMTVFLFTTFALGVLFLLPFYLWEYLSVPSFRLTSLTGLSVLYLGVFASLVSFFMWNKAILIVGPSRTAFIYYLMPVFSGLSAWLFLGEEIRPVHGISMIMIAGGVLIANRPVRGAGLPDNFP